MRRFHGHRRWNHVRQNRSAPPLFRNRSARRRRRRTGQIPVRRHHATSCGVAV